MIRFRTIITMAVVMTGIMTLNSCKLSSHRGYPEIVNKYLNKEGLVTFGDDGNSDRFTLGGTSFDAKDVNNLEIEWYNDTITIQTYDGNEVVFSETSDRTLTDSTTMHYYLDSHGTLEIVFGRPNTKMKGEEVPEKHLTVLVPRTLLLYNVEVNGVGQEIRLDSVRCKNLEINSVTNYVILNECDIEEIELNNTSTFLEATFSNMPEKMELNSVSVNAVLYVPEDAGITWEQNGIKNNFSSELPVHRKGSKQIIGDGSCKIEANAISGELEVKLKGNK